MADAEEVVINTGLLRDSLKCALCLSLLSRPMQTPCQHRFCEDCVQLMWPPNGLCPTCRERAPRRSLRRDHLVRSLLTDQAVRCPNHHMGCHWTGPEGTRPIHERDCLARHVAELQTNVDELERGIAERDVRIVELTEELDKHVRVNAALRAEADAMKEQAELDRAIIESLRSLDMSSSMRIKRNTLQYDGVFVEVGVQTLTSSPSAHVAVSFLKRQAGAVEVGAPESGLVHRDTTEQTKAIDDLKIAPGRDCVSSAEGVLLQEVTLLTAAEKGDIALVRDLVAH